MQPIVNGLEEQYPDIIFVPLNAQDAGRGQLAVEQLNVRGHPAILLFNRSGEEIYRGYGIIEAEFLDSKLKELEEQ